MGGVRRAIVDSGRLGVVSVGHRSGRGARCHRSGLVPGGEEADDEAHDGAVDARLDGGLVGQPAHQRDA